MKNTKTALMRFLGGPWDGVVIPVDCANFKPPQNLWVFRVFADFGDGVFVIFPRISDMRTSPGPGKHGPYTACLSSAEGRYDYVWRPTP